MSVSICAGTGGRGELRTALCAGTASIGDESMAPQSAETGDVLIAPYASAGDNLTRVKTLRHNDHEEQSLDCATVSQDD
jgi:hypothetical protein